MNSRKNKKEQNNLKDKKNKNKKDDKSSDKNNERDKKSSKKKNKFNKNKENKLACWIYKEDKENSMKNNNYKKRSLKCSNNKRNLYKKLIRLNLIKPVGKRTKNRGWPTLLNISKVGKSLIMEQIRLVLRRKFSIIWKDL